MSYIPKEHLLKRKVVDRMFPVLVPESNIKEVVMKREKDNWLDEYAVTCRVFKGRWSIRHCLRIYSEIRDLKIEMATRGRGGIRRYESCYNPCERCSALVNKLKDLEAERAAAAQTVPESTNGEFWAACG